MNIEVRAVLEDEQSECLDLWKTVWPDNRPGFFERYFYGDEEYQPEYTRVAVLDGGIVSAVQIVKRIISCCGFTLTLGGIANVATHPDYRGHGFALQCLRQAIQVMEADAMDLSLLFTSVDEFYARAGYQPVSCSTATGELRQDPIHLYNRLVVRPYEDRDDACIHLIHVAYNRERPLSVRRSSAYWRDWLNWSRGQAPGRATVVEDEGVVVGYCLYQADEDAGVVRVREFGVRDGADQALDALIEEAAGTARSHHLLSMSIPMHDHPAVEEVCARLFVNKTVEPKRSAMVRFLHKDNLLRGLAPMLMDRWRRCGSPPGSISFTGPYGDVRLCCRGQFLHFDEAADPDQMLSQSELLDLLTGAGLPHDRLSRADMLFANALFPAQRRWFWEVDAF